MLEFDCGKGVETLSDSTVTSDTVFNVNDIHHLPALALFSCITGWCNCMDFTCRRVGLQVGVGPGPDYSSPQVLLGSAPMSGWGSRSLRCRVSPVPTHVGLERPGSGGLRPAWNPECTNLFPALVMVSPARPGTFLEPSSVQGCLCLEPAVSARPGGLGSVRWVSLAECFSCSGNDTSPTTSSIPVNMESNGVMLTRAFVRA